MPVEVELPNTNNAAINRRDPISAGMLLRNITFPSWSFAGTIIAHV